MYKVNESKMVDDYKSLLIKKEQGTNEVEHAAAVFADQRGYSEEKKAKFIEYLKSNESCGLSSEDIARLNILKEYIEDVELNYNDANIDGNENGEVID